MKQLDLNLLRTFVVLLEKKNTRIAAESLATSQSAVSKSLSKLRLYFADELFTRVHSGLEPTPRAIELGKQVGTLLTMLDEAITDTPSFDAQQFDGDITIAMNGFISNWLGATLCTALLKQAPNAKINIINWDPNTLERIKEGSIQLAINYSPIESSKQFVQHKVAVDQYVGLVRKGHPLAGKRMNEEQAKQAAFASLVVPAWNENLPFINYYFQQNGITANTQIRSSYLHMLLDVVTSSDLILPCSAMLAASLHEQYATVEFPFPTPQELSSILVIESQNKRRHPMQTWLVNVVSCTLDSLSRAAPA
ncbi:TPA: LysR family transcriptional regulator [Vibrio vulnificus]